MGTIICPMNVCVSSDFPVTNFSNSVRAQTDWFVTQCKRRNGVITRWSVSTDSFEENGANTKNRTTARCTARINHVSIYYYTKQKNRL